MRIIETMSATQTERSALVTKQVELLTKLFNLSKEKELLNTTLQELHTKVTALNTKLEVHLKAASNLDRRSLGKNNVAKINAEQTNKILSIYNESREKDETAEGKTIIGLREVDLEIKALKNREGEVNQTATLIFDKYTGVIKDSSFNNTYFK